MEKSIIGKYQFYIEPYITDYRGKLTMAMIVNYLLESATRHAQSRGFGYANMKSANKAWVLSRLVVEINDYPQANDMLEIETWVGEVNKLFTMRNFELSIGGKTIGYAKSVWAAIHIDTRKPSNLLELDNDLASYITNRSCPIERSSSMKGIDVEEMRTHDVRYSDLDINQHFNSAKYVEHIIDLFPLDIFEQKQVQRFEIAFVNETRYGSILHFHIKEIGTDVFHVDIKKENAETVVRSIVIFK